MCADISAKIITICIDITHHISQIYLKRLTKSISDFNMLASIYCSNMSIHSIKIIQIRFNKSNESIKV